MKNQKTIVITIALFLALISLSCSALRPTYPGYGLARVSAPGTQKFAPVKQSRWGSPRERELRKLIGKNNIRIRQLEQTIEQSKSTRLSPGTMGTVRKELNQLKRDNKQYQRELNDPKRQGPPRKQQPPRRPRN